MAAVISSCTRPYVYVCMYVTMYMYVCMHVCVCVVLIPCYLCNFGFHTLIFATGTNVQKCSANRIIHAWIIIEFKFGALTHLYTWWSITNGIQSFLSFFIFLYLSHSCLFFIIIIIISEWMRTFNEQTTIHQLLQKITWQVLFFLSRKINVCDLLCLI